MRLQRIFGKWIVMIGCAFAVLATSAGATVVEKDGRVLTLAPSGWTYKRTFVLYDRETGTLWYPYENGLMGIQGTFFKKWLPLVPSVNTTWREWSKKHPTTRLMR